jgi:5-dehydro-2-deoxygluconokinase
LLEIVSSRYGELEEDTTARVLSRVYELDIRPDWWKLEPQPSGSAWQRCADVIAAQDPYCRGMVVLGLDAPLEELTRSLRLAATQPMVRGFAVGRTIFASAAEAWLAGRIPDHAAVDEMAERFGSLVEVWYSAEGSTQ